METTTVNGMVYGAVQNITPSSSPFTWMNPEATRVQVLISAGTVTDISHSADGINFNTAGLLGGLYLLNSGQSVRVTYLVAPTMKYWPT